VSVAGGNDGLASKLSEPDDRVIASVRWLADPLFADKPCVPMPVFSSEQSDLQPPETDARAGPPIASMRREEETWGIRTGAQVVHSKKPVRPAIPRHMSAATANH